MLSALIHLAASFELRWFLLPSGSRRCSAHPGWAFPTARVFVDLFNSWSGVRAGGIKSKVWGCCLLPVGHLVGRKGVRRSWFGGRSEHVLQVWGMSLTLVWIVWMEALAELAPSADKHHYWFFCNVRWEEMTLKAFQGRAGDAIGFEVRCSILCVKCGVTFGCTG